MAKLTVLVDNRPIQNYRIIDKITIGRDSNNHIQLLDNKVSRRHSIIEHIKGFYIVRDLGSRNGTFLNEVPIWESELNTGDRIRVGETLILFEEEIPWESQDILNSQDADTILSDRSIFVPSPVDIRNLAELRIGDETIPKMKEKIAGLGVLLEAYHSFCKADTSHRLLLSVVHQISKLFAVDHISILMRDDNSQTWVPVLSRHHEDKKNAPDCPGILLKRVLTERISLLLFNSPKQDRSTSLHQYADEPLIDIGVPLQGRECIVGVIYMQMKSTQKLFTEGVLEILTAIGMSAGNVLEKLMQWEKAKNIRSELVKTMVPYLELLMTKSKRHSLRVAGLASNIALKMGISGIELERLELAGLLHGIHSTHMNNTVHLSFAGLDIDPELPADSDSLRHIDGISDIAQMIRYQSENFDGSGDPDHLRETEIPLGSRIIAVSCAFDEMIHAAEASIQQNAIDIAMREIMKRRGTRFDPEVVKAFQECMISGGEKDA